MVSLTAPEKALVPPAEVQRGFPQRIVPLAASVSKVEVEALATVRLPLWVIFPSFAVTA